eukprot:8337033-Pyramimonas_sp.AAC.1
MAFGEDNVDETPDVAVWLTGALKLRQTLEINLLRRPGTHIRPLQQLIPAAPPNVAYASRQGKELLGALASLAGPLGAKGTPLGNLRSSVDSIATSTEASNKAIEEDLTILAQDVLR